MKKITLIILTLFLISCNKRDVWLPQVHQCNLMTEINDYSVIYVFFDETTQKADLNRNNLITSTHWVFNIDRRLSLTEAGKNIVELQEKKDAPNIHKNPDSRNFFSVADMGDKKLKFLEFTKTHFYMSKEKSDTDNILKKKDLSDFSDNIKNKKSDVPDTISVSGDISFQDFIVFLQKIQDEGIFFKNIIII
ncbi:hypothetical protein [Capnocytophaga stomatis]|uniref:Uncharacterized protein n=1 Tax=Capnocytophaga stomatis TaxID=1848904 RepID=A0ABW8Q8A0_9FLAO|nr:hypothetical protein [Capnocytophaga stomatis]